MTANAFCEVAANVTVEPLLQPLNGENLGQAANKEDSARVDIRAGGFWGNTAQEAFFLCKGVLPIRAYLQKPKA